MINDANGPTIARIVSRLDGLPLAIELAAARLRILSIEAISQRLDSRLSLLTGGARDLPERQQTLRARSSGVMNSSSRDRRAVHAAFGVRRRFALEDAEPTLEVPYDLLLGLETLVDQSLLRP